MSIDVVYTWVNETDPIVSMRMQDARRMWPFQTEGRDALKRYRTRSFNELYYSMRTVRKHAIGMRSMLLVTSGEWPTFPCKGVRRVRHEEYIPARHLPTFDVFLIQRYLFRIKNLSKTFVLMDDDMFIMSPFFLEREKGFRYHAKEGKNWPSHPLSSREFLRGVQNANLLLRKLYPSHVQENVPSHTPRFVNKTTLYFINSNFPLEGGVGYRPFRSLFRPNINILLNAVERREGNTVHMCGDGVVDFVEMGRASVETFRSDLSRVLQRPKRFLCINDCISGQNTGRYETALASFLERVV